MDNVECMAYMFDFCKSLKSLPNISNWITSSVKDMSYMFHNCWSLTSFPKLNWDISNVQNMSFMFHNFPLSLIRFKWNISEHQNTFHMFTNFDNYHNPIYGNNIINVIVDISNGFKSNVLAYSDILIMDVIDKFYNINTDLDYPFDIKFLYNGQTLDMSRTISEYFPDTLYMPNSITITGILPLLP